MALFKRALLEPGVKRSGIGFNLADSHPEGFRQISELGHTAPHADPTALDGLVRQVEALRHGEALEK